MDIYIDFDDTLMHRTRMTDEIFSTFADVTQEELKQHYADFRVAQPFTVDAFENYLIDHGLDGAKLTSLFFDFAARAEQYVFEDAKAFLTALRADGHRLIILSFDAEPDIWQRPKIDASRLGAYVDEVLVTSMAKADLLQSIGAQEPFVFIDDKQSEIDAMQTAFPNAICLKHEPGAPLLLHLDHLS